MLGPGNLVGLPSLLRAEGCEEVSAATAVEAWALPDTLVADLYASEAGFRAWCNTTVFPSGAGQPDRCPAQPERASPLRPAGCAGQGDAQGPRPGRNRRCLQRPRGHATSLCGQRQQQRSPEHTSLTLATSLPSSEGTFAFRLLSLPRAIVDQIRAGQNSNKARPPARRHEQDAPSQTKPMASPSCRAAPASICWQGSARVLDADHGHRSAARKHGLLPDAGPTDGTALPA